MFSFRTDATLKLNGIAFLCVWRLFLLLTLHHPEKDNDNHYLSAAVHCSTLPQEMRKNQITDLSGG